MENQKQKPDFALELSKIINLDEMKPNSLIAFKIKEDKLEGSIDVLRYVHDRYGKLLREKNCTIIVLEDGVNLEELDENSMNRAGWFKKEQKRIITLK